jgi:LacI family transcriptional regulator
MSKPARKRITAHDVAARAGVSQPTVSLVLSGNPQARVAEATRVRVLEAARELGYRPNLLARGLVQRRSYALGIIVPDLDNPFFIEVVSGAERVAAAEGYAVLLCDRRETPLARHFETLHSRQVDGILMDAASAAALGATALAGLNVALIDEPTGEWPGVATDAAEAGRQAAEHLIALGHRAIGFIGPATDTYTFRMRERGFVHTLRRAGIPIQSAVFRRAPATVAGGREAMRELLAAHSGVTGVFCANDLVALGALKTCITAGIAVPGQMSIIGCDDIEMARIVTPELTTIMVPARGLGALAARELLRRIDGRTGKPSSGKLLPVELVVRRTTAAAPREGAP